MKAVVVSEFGPFRLAAAVGEIPDPIPLPTEVRVRMQAIDINYPDILVIEGKYQVRPPLPFTPGKAGAGIVDAVGHCVTAFRPGDRVVLQVEYGAYSESVTVEQGACYPIPDSIAFDTAAALGLASQTAFFALTDRGSMSEGERVLVLGGSGAVGHATIQLARAKGAGLVIGGARGEENRRIAANAGAHATVDLGVANLRDSLREAVLEVTGGAGVDLIVDPIGGEVTQAALRCLAWRGRLVLVGFASGLIPKLRGNYLLVKNISVSGLQWSDYRDRQRVWVSKAQAEIFDICARGDLSPLISERFELEDVALALAAVQNGNVKGKPIFEITARAEA